MLAEHSTKVSDAGKTAEFADLGDGVLLRLQQFQRIIEPYYLDEIGRR